MNIDIISIVGFLVFLSLVLISYLVWKFVRDTEYKRRYAELNIGDRFFLLDAYTGNKCIIEVKYVSPFKGDAYVIVESNGKQHKFSMYEFFTNVLMKTNRYYYEKIDNNSFKNIN